MEGRVFAEELEEELMKYTEKPVAPNTGNDGVSAMTDASKANKAASAPKKGANSAKKREEMVIKSATKPPNLDEGANEARGDDVDITGGPKIPGHRLIEAGPVASTESSSSSSFGATDDSGDELSGAFDESEATSSLHGDEESSRMSAKRRKVSGQWKAHVQPVAWRLRWTELHMKLLNVFSDGYDRKLEDCNKLKQLRFDRSETDASSSRQFPCPHGKDANRVLRRKKRNKAEYLTDLSKYMAHHNLFSYYGNRRKNAQPAPVAAAPKFMTEEESWSSVEHILKRFQTGETSSDAALRRIFDLESKVGAMRGRAKELLHDNSASIGTYIAAQLMSEYSPNDDIAPDEEAAVHENTARRNGDGGDIIGGRGAGEEGSVNPSSSSIAGSGSMLTGPRSKRTGGSRGGKKGSK